MAVGRMDVPMWISAKARSALPKGGISHCYVCTETCKKGLLNKIKPYAFTLFAKVTMMNLAMWKS